MSYQIALVSYVLLKYHGPSRYGLQNNFPNKKHLFCTGNVRSGFKLGTEDERMWYKRNRHRTHNRRMTGWHWPCIKKVLSSWSVATGLISVRRFINLPTTRGALLKPRILQEEIEKLMTSIWLSTQLWMFTLILCCHMQCVYDRGIHGHRRTVDTSQDYVGSIHSEKWSQNI